MNLYKQFKALIPDAPLLIGDVVADMGGVYVIEEPGGGRSQARGNALFAVGDRVFFRDGLIEGTAPDLPVELIDV